MTERHRLKEPHISLVHVEKKSDIKLRGNVLQIINGFGKIYRIDNSEIAALSTFNMKQFNEYHYRLRKLFHTPDRNILPYEPHTFDTVVSIFPLQRMHLALIPHFVYDIAALLKNGGIAGLWPTPSDRVSASVIEKDSSLLAALQQLGVNCSLEYLSYIEKKYPELHRVYGQPRPHWRVKLSKKLAA